MNTQEITAKWYPAAVKQYYNANPNAGHFFDRDTMRFFGDTMRSFGCTEIDGQPYMYRKRTATVNVFGRYQQAGRDFFNAWKITEEKGRVDLACCGTEETEAVYQHLYSHA